jgi:hypothetical protein
MCFTAKIRTIIMDHNKIVSNIAKEVLSPLGMKRQGKRLWYDDHGWFAIIAEFQPSAWDKGSFLNVGISFMFYEHHHWTFDHGYREEDFVSAKSEEQFAESIRMIAESASRSVRRYRDLASDLSALRSEMSKSINHPDDWGHYYAGILSGLAGLNDQARLHLSSITQVPCTCAWMHGRRIRCLELLNLLDDAPRFRETLLGIVMRCRAERFPEIISSDLVHLP